MDTSKEYIKMCEQAQEIQKPSGLMFSEGSFVFNKSANNGNGHIFVNYKHQPYEDQADWELIYRRGKYASFNIWLPRQDQLQKLIAEYKHWSIYDLFCHFKDFYRKENWELILFLSSFEKLWLSFVMKNKFNKIYNMKKEIWIENK